jgi:protein CpxP
MSMVKSSLTRTAALAVVLGTVAFASPSFSAPIDPTAPSGPPNSTLNFDSNGNVVSHTPDTSDQSGMMMQQDNTIAPTTSAPMHHHHHHADQTAQPVADQGAAPAPAAAPMKAHKEHMGMKDHSPEEMKAHVEERITSLHSKLMITPAQEGQWNDVAQAMRDSESSVGTLVRERHENAANMTAVDDLESYQAIAEAHSEGLKKVNVAFKTLYDGMSDDQKKNADKVFGGYEGHGPEHHGMHHHHKKAAK